MREEASEDGEGGHGGVGLLAEGHEALDGGDVLALCLVVEDV